MAREASSTTFTIVEGGNACDDEQLVNGSESGWVEARTHCDHLAALSSDSTHIPTPDTSCYRCRYPSENWVCLSCKDVFCSRFVNQHMLQHHQQKNHCLALSYSDLSVWCFGCDAYLDAQVILPLRAFYETAYMIKFGEAPPVRAIVDDDQAHGSTSRS